MLFKRISDVKDKESTLVLENKWADWEPKLKNCLLTMVGMDGTPLSYIIRENDATDVAVVFSSFNKELIASAPLNGVLYQAD